GTPAACSWFSHHLDVVAEQPDHTLAHTSWNGSSWTSWVSLGTFQAHDPTLVSRSSGQLDLVVRDLGGAIQHRLFAYGYWYANWGWIGGSFTGRPAVVGSSPTQLDIVARGMDRALWHKTQVAGAWSPAGTDWRALGGLAVDSPSACATALSGGGRRLH